MRGSRQSSFMLAEPPTVRLWSFDARNSGFSWAALLCGEGTSGKKNGLAIPAHPSKRARFSPLGVPLMLVQLWPSREPPPLFT